jgi:hypothetical protein
MFGNCGECTNTLRAFLPWIIPYPTRALMSFNAHSVGAPIAPLFHSSIIAGAPLSVTLDHIAWHLPG